MSMSRRIAIIAAWVDGARVNWAAPFGPDVTTKINAQAIWSFLLMHINQLPIYELINTLFHSNYLKERSPDASPMRDPFFNPDDRETIHTGQVQCMGMLAIQNARRRSSSFPMLAKNVGPLALNHSYCKALETFNRAARSAGTIEAKTTTRSSIIGAPSSSQG